MNYVLVTFLIFEQEIKLNTLYIFAAKKDTEILEINQYMNRFSLKQIY